ncbi:MAG TPA: hypothetical protein VGR57_10775, partial [Ktedonobacterales bacterium]|nr:hypothetical protein [Ktedonobacterales bacterium]
MTTAANGDQAPPAPVTTLAPSAASPAASSGGASPPSVAAAHARSDLYFKQFLGLLAIAFPFILLFGKMLFDGVGIQPSISDYYYTDSMKNVLTGGLAALAILLICYRYAPVDNVASTLAGLFAIGVALFPKAPDSGASQRQMTTGTLHYVFAASFFVVIAWYALFVFTRPAPPFPQLRAWLRRLIGKRGLPADERPAKDLTSRKRVRNGIYLACGGVIVACIVALLLPRVFPITFPAGANLEFWLETLAVCAFGFAWVVKGEILLTDQGAPNPDRIQYV